MKIIGITGGVGAGKSEILNYIEVKYNARVIKADLAAHELQMPGKACYEKLVDYFGADILNTDGYIDKSKMASLIFYNPKHLETINSIVHPAVKEYIIEEIQKEKARQKYKFFFIEAALLIEDGYEKICEELWYIYADKETRQHRLRESRNYSDEKIEAIFSKQLEDTVFRKHCKVIIDNSRSLEDSFLQIDKNLGGI